MEFTTEELAIVANYKALLFENIYLLDYGKKDLLERNYRKDMDALHTDLLLQGVNIDDINAELVENIQIDQALNYYASRFEFTQIKDPLFIKATEDISVQYGYTVEQATQSYVEQFLPNIRLSREDIAKYELTKSEVQFIEIENILKIRAAENGFYNTDILAMGPENSQWRQKLLANGTKENHREK